MNFKSINDEQNKSMKNSLVQDSYKWDDSNLFSYLRGYLPEQQFFHRYYGKELSTEELEQNKIIQEINKLIGDYNHNITSTKVRFFEIDKLYSKLEKYIDKYLTAYDSIKSQFIFNRTILLNGPGGIGKSQFLYELSQQLPQDSFLTIYGKYCPTIDINVLNEIQNISKEKRFYFIIDAINELDQVSQDLILKFMKNNKSNRNLRIIVSYRDFSLNSIILNKLKLLADKEELFTGVSADYALEKISQKYNLDLSIYSRLLYDNNPLHLKMIIKSISDNQLNRKGLKAITKGTYIYEHFIKDVLSRKEWCNTKNILDYMVTSQSKRIDGSNLKSILGNDLSQYVKKMKQNQFADTYISEKTEYFYFINETLTDYLIARNLFDKFNNMNEKDIITFVNNIINIFATIQIPIILLLLEKYENDILKAINIIHKSDLNHHFDLNVFNEAVLSSDNMKKLTKYIKPNITISEILRIAGGNEGNPFNCTNYLNDKITNNDIIFSFKYDKYEKKELRNRIKIYARSISKFNYNQYYLREKLYFGLYLLSVPDKILRSLCEKMIFEIINSDETFIEEIIKFYYKYNDEYIQESIVLILGSFKKNSRSIIDFFKKINDENLVNQNMLYHIDRYLNEEENYAKYSKVNYMNYKGKRKNLKILKFLRSVFFTNKYDYDFFGFDSYSDKIHFQIHFLLDNKNNISEINNYIEKNYTCLYCDNNCSPTHFKELIVDKKFKINEETIIDNDLYLAWENIFKNYLRKHKIKISQLEHEIAVEELDKGIVYKLLDLSFSKICGSVSCNYYTNKFEIYSSDKGFQQNYFNPYHEKHQIFYPISVYSETIEVLNNKVTKQVYIPNIKDIVWVNDASLALNNTIKIISTIEYNSEQWVPIYGSVRFKGNLDNRYGYNWMDTYIFNLAVDENYNLTLSPDNDRKYTIESAIYTGNIHEVYKNQFSQTSSLNNSSSCKDEFPPTDFNIPPTEIINYFNLHYCNSTSSWNNSADEIVLLINNNEGSWYNEGVSGSIFFKKTFFDIFFKNHNYKYFCFTEKFIPETGYSSESAMQIQINSDGTILNYKHYKEENKTSKKHNNCQDCVVYLQQEKEKRNFKYEELLSKISTIKNKSNQRNSPKKNDC